MGSLSSGQVKSESDRERQLARLFYANTRAVWPSSRSRTRTSGVRNEGETIFFSSSSFFFFFFLTSLNWLRSRERTYICFANGATSHAWERGREKPEKEDTRKWGGGGGDTLESLRCIYLYISRAHCFFSNARSVSVVDVASFMRALDPVRTIGQGRGHEEAVPAEVTEFIAWKPSTQAEGRKGERERERERKNNAREASESLLKSSTKRTPMTSRASADVCRPCAAA